MRGPRIPTRTLTTAHISAAHPFYAGSALDHGGVLIGRDLASGRMFAFDPWRLYAEGRITNPGTVIAGQVGLGKSALVKTYLARQASLGRRSVVIDPKGEYATLAAWFGSSPIRLRPGGTTRLNPLDPAIGADAHVALVAAIAELGLERRLHPLERVACDGACAAVAGTPAATLAGVVAALRDPATPDARRIGLTPARLADETRALTLALGRLCDGELAGMLDGPSTADVRLDAPVVVFDLQALRDSAALGVVMACIAAWHEGRPPGGARARIFVVDEAWALVARTATAEFFQRAWKLARASGVQHILVVHRISDLQAAGDQGSRVARIAEGLVAESEICVLLRQSHSDLALTRTRLGLSDAETELVTRLARGCALWRVGRRSFAVAHVISDAERALIDTDDPMRAAPA